MDSILTMVFPVTFFWQYFRVIWLTIRKKVVRRLLKEQWGGNDRVN